ncbi:uncharacterized protein A4U43_C02F180 [Asparagus officinalis]|uniref:Uncharacterized protein n=1 Tax=Asparagus officinalis TaxID=4686 RepID=A0A5P1FJI9_ASPOF|nr:uncharacterized protein A4U43_C02F180 [Asparagus officinalis]
MATPDISATAATSSPNSSLQFLHPLPPSALLCGRSAYRRFERTSGPELLVSDPGGISGLGRRFKPSPPSFGSRSASSSVASSDPRPFQTAAEAGNNAFENPSRPQSHRGLLRREELAAGGSEAPIAASSARRESGPREELKQCRSPSAWTSHLVRITSLEYASSSLEPSLPSESLPNDPVEKVEDQPSSRDHQILSAGLKPRSS